MSFQSASKNYTITDSIAGFIKPPLGKPLSFSTPWEAISLGQVFIPRGYASVENNSVKITEDRIGKFCSTTICNHLGSNTWPKEK